MPNSLGFSVVPNIQVPVESDNSVFYRPVKFVPRDGTIISTATPSINTNLFDYYSITALAVNITSFTTGLSGSPVAGQTLYISITDNGVPASIAWGTSFESSTVVLPTLTVASTRLDVGFIWNESTSKWRCINVA